MFESRLLVPYTLPSDFSILQILLGDAIVCWRTCVLWPKNRIVNGICVAFLLATLGMSIPPASLPGCLIYLIRY